MYTFLDQICIKKLLNQPILYRLFIDIYHVETSINRRVA